MHRSARWKPSTGSRGRVLELGASGHRLCRTRVTMVLRSLTETTCRPSSELFGTKGPNVSWRKRARPLARWRSRREISRRVKTRAGNRTRRERELSLELVAQNVLCGQGARSRHKRPARVTACGCGWLLPDAVVVADPRRGDTELGRHRRHDRSESPAASRDHGARVSRG